MRLTDPVIKAAKPQEKDFTLSDGEGLALLIRPNGAKLWRFRYRFHGKSGLLSLGIYPNVTLKQARLERDQLREQLQQGINPSFYRQEKKLTAKFAMNYSR